METHTTTYPPETSANTQRSDGWMRRLVLHLRSRRRLQIEERIARLTAELEYWRGKTTEKGTIPEHICDDIAARLGEIAALRVRLVHILEKQKKSCRIR